MRFWPAEGFVKMIIAGLIEAVWSEVNEFVEEEGRKDVACLEEPMRSVNG